MPAIKFCDRDLQKNEIEKPFFFVSVFSFEGVRCSDPEKSTSAQHQHPEADQDGRTGPGPPLGLGGIDQIRNVSLFCCCVSQGT